MNDQEQIGGCGKTYKPARLNEPYKKKKTGGKDHNPQEFREKNSKEHPREQGSDKTVGKKPAVPMNP